MHVEHIQGKYSEWNAGAEGGRGPGPGRGYQGRFNNSTLDVSLRSDLLYVQEVITHFI